MANSLRVVFLVPWRTDDGPRAAAWAVCRRRWEAQFPDWPIYEGPSPEGPFQRAAAINEAARQAGKWDVAVIIDADVMLPPKNVREAVRRAAKSGRVAWAHRRWRGLSKEATERLTGPKGEAHSVGMLGPGGITGADFSGADIDLIVEKTNAFSWSCCIAIRRDAWDTIGGFDERFIGWGHEDGAFMSAAGALVGWERIEGDVLNLWHPRNPGSGRADRDNRNRYTKQALVNGRLGLRYMVALRRDFGLTDRPERSSPEVIARDIANLKEQDRTEFEAPQSEKDRAPWTGWWPTIDELVAQSKAYITERRSGSVTVIVHTGGEMEAWAKRKPYLEESIASLEANVSGPIIKKVIYSLWSDPAILKWLMETYGPRGYVVVGPDPSIIEEWRAEGKRSKRVWYEFASGMQAMWTTYLAKHAKGEFIFQVEDDFTYERPVNLGDLAEVLRANPDVVQMALLRDACYPDERETGGILGWPKPAFTFREQWFEHRLFFTLNPSLFRRSLTERPWPSGRHSETLFGKSIIADKRLRFAFWGQGEEWIRHIGEVRAGSGY